MSLATAVGRFCSEALSRLPARFQLVRGLGVAYTGRSLVFHHVSDDESPFTEGLGVRMAPDEFAAALAFFAEHYRLLALDDWLAAVAAPERGKPPLLLTFDDAYASVARVAAPLCQERGIPSLFFVNAGLIDNPTLALDNLACYAVNTHGMDLLECVAKRPLRDLRAFIVDFLPTLSGAARGRLEDELAAAAGVDRAQLAAEAGLYLGGDELRALPGMGVEIGNHTLSHVHLRSLSPGELAREIEGGRSRLEELSGTRVRAFSYPYGSAEDGGPEVGEAVAAGHAVAFLVGAGTNTSKTPPLFFQRVSLKEAGDAASFAQVEVLPRLRALRDRLRRTR